MLINIYNTIELYVHIIIQIQILIHQLIRISIFPFLSLSSYISISNLKQYSDLRMFLGKISTTFARKTATSICTVIPGICLLILCYIGCRHYEAVSIMSVGIVAMGAMFSGFLSNHIDIAPNFAGTLVALTNTAATLPGIIVPLFVGFVTHGNVSVSKETRYFRINRIYPIAAKYWSLAYHLWRHNRFVRSGVLSFRHIWIGRRTIVEPIGCTEGCRS